MKHGYKMVRDASKKCPLPLLDLKDSKLIKYAESLLPYETGIEIECELIKGALLYPKIPFIVDIELRDYEELRFRIPKGIKGMVCLYYISEYLRENAHPNEKSGIHYHIDFRDLFFELRCNWLKHTKHVLLALKSWGYSGQYNAWEISTDKKAVRIHSDHETMEYRIGEMTFDYELLIKRIIHCQNISRKVKDSLKSSYPKRGKTKVTGPKIIGRIQF